MNMSLETQPEKVVYTPIGVVASSFNEPGDPKTMRNAESTLILDEKYLGALDGLDRYRYLLVIYHIDRSPGYRERVHPMGDYSIPERGVLATRSPCRLNPLGITLAEILSIEGNKIRVIGLDALNGTPILDTSTRRWVSRGRGILGTGRRRVPIKFNFVLASMHAILGLLSHFSHTVFIVAVIHNEDKLYSKLNTIYEV
jgi:formylmethanofuran dehydrogenase subunit E